MKSIKKVTLSFLLLALALFTTSAMAALPDPTIVDVLIASNSEGPYAGEFDTLIAAIDAHPLLLEILSGNGQVTLFAPTDDAFAAEGLNPENIFYQGGGVCSLLYLMAHGHLYLSAENMFGKQQIRTFSKIFCISCFVPRGSLLEYSDGTLTDPWGREANIIGTNIEAANGIIHVIDLLPVACPWE